jgi:Leucine-rich repeat (LRR) protein
MLTSAMATGALVTPLSTRHSMVRVEFPSGPNLIEDSALSALSSIKNNISHINFASTSISDKAMAFVAGSPNLVYLNLRNTSITDRGIALIAKAQHLEYLNMVSTQITDKSINVIANFKTLKSVYVYNSGITEKGIQSLQSALPNAKIVY